MRMNASNSRVSTGMSLLSGGPEPGVPPLLRKSNIIYRPSPDRIEPPRMKRMAARQPLHTHPDAASHSILFHGLPHLFRATRVVAASRRQERRHRYFVQTQNAAD